MTDVITTAVDKKQLEDLQKPAPVKPSEPAKLTEDQVNEVIELLIDVSRNNGYVSIAHATGVTHKDVVKIHDAMQARIATLTPVDDLDDLVEPEPVKPEPIDGDVVEVPVR